MKFYGIHPNYKLLSLILEPTENDYNQRHLILF